KTAGAATLTASGAVTQSGGIVATTLSVTTRNANGAAITLDGPGNTATKVDFNVLKSATTDAANADVAYTGDAGFEIVNVKTAGTATFTAHDSVTEVNGNSIVADKLLLLGSGSYGLISTANDVARLAANSSGSVTYQDANSFTVDRVGTVDGIGATATGVRLLAKTNLTVAKNIASDSGLIELLADSDGDGAGTLQLNANASVSSGLTVPSGSSEAVILSGAVFDFGTNSAAQATGVGGGVAIRSSDSTRTINLGAGGGAGDLVVDVPIFSHISTLTSGFIAVGDSTQSGDIRISGPTFGTTGEIRVVQSTSKSGQIILDDANAVTALDGGNRNIVLTAGTKGVASVHGTNNLAEIATTGAKVTINTRGGIGSSLNPLQFADNGNLTQQNVTIGAAVRPTSNVYLGGIGALTLGSIRLSSANLDVSASGAVAEAAGARILANTLSVTTRNDVGASINLANSGNQVTTLALSALKSSNSAPANAQVSYASSTGVTISGLNTAGTAILVLGGDIDQIGGIVAGTLQVTTQNDTGAAINLTGPGNVVSKIDFSALKSTTSDTVMADIAYTGDAGFEIVNVKTAGTATLTAHADVTQSGGIVAGTLRVTTRKDTGAAIALDGPGNAATNVDFSTLMSTTSDAAKANISYTGDAGLNIVNVKTSGTATFSARGGVTQSGGIVADTLRVTTRNDNGAAITLNNTGNTATNVDFGTLKFANTDAAAAAITYTGDAGFNIVNVKTAGTATLTARDVVTQSGGVVAGTLRVTTRSANGAAIQLKGSGNNAARVDFSTLKSDNTTAAADVNYTGDAGFDIVNIQSSGIATLTAGGAVTQSTGSIRANALKVTTTSDPGAAITLTRSTNDVQTLDLRTLSHDGSQIQTADVSFVDTSGFAIVNLSSAGTVSLTAGGEVTQSSAIQVQNLLLSGTGPWILDSGNDVGVIAGSNLGTVTLRDINNLKVGTVAGVSGLSASTNGAVVSLIVAQTLTVSNPLKSTAGDVRLTVNRLDLQSDVVAQARITILPQDPNLPIDLGNATAGKFGITLTDLARFSAQVLQIGNTGTASISVTESIKLDSVNTLQLESAAGVSETGVGKVTVANLVINAGGAVAFAAANDVVSLAANVGGDLVYRDTSGFAVASAGIDANGHNVSLTADQGVSQSGAIQGANLRLSGAGPWALNTQLNKVTSLTADVQGNLLYRDADGFVVTGIDAHGHDVSLTAAQEVTQSGEIRGGNLSLNGAGPWKLDSQQNNVQNLAASVQGDLFYRDADGFNVTGIFAETHNVSLTAGGGVTQSGDIRVRDLTLTGTGAGSWTLNRPQNHVSTLSADV
ncbi:MAG: hypothetical protein NT069_06805, partial [Planctomycetota bacterium]|nr:hypothetical protein [Planctomycetota bacterium]